jgi:cell division protein ZapA
MDRRPIELRIAGQSYRVMSSAPEADLRRLAEMVEAKMAEAAPRGRPQSSQTVLLAAMSLAHELEAERGRRESLERRTRELLQRVLTRIDDALAPLEGHYAEDGDAANGGGSGRNGAR